MEIKQKILREKLNEENELTFTLIKKLLEEEEGGLMLDVEITDLKKGNIKISGYGYTGSIRDRHYAEQYKAHQEDEYAMLTQIDIMGDYAYIYVFIPYPWLTERDLLENPSPEDEQKVPSLKSAAPEPQRIELEVVGLKHHADKSDIVRLFEMKDKQIPVTLTAEPENEKDPFAVCVLLPDGKKVGYIKGEKSPFVSLLSQERGPLEAQVGYVNEYQWRFDCTLTVESDMSAGLINLFSRHTPQEIYKAYIANRMWIETWDDETDVLFLPDSMRIDFDRLLKTTIEHQNIIASEWHDLMYKAKVYNPTNPGLLMSVPLDLADYGTSWKKFDLRKDYLLLSTIESDNKILAFFLRYRREVNRRATIEEFEEVTNIDIDTPELRKRMEQEASKLY